MLCSFEGHMFISTELRLKSLCYRNVYLFFLLLIWFNGNCEMQLIDLYTKIILNKVELKGCSRDSIEMFLAKTFEDYTGSIDSCSVQEDNFYNEKLDSKSRGKKPDLIFCPI